MNGWGQFFLGVLALAFMAGAHRRLIRYQLVKRMIENQFNSESIVDVIEAYNDGNLIDSYINSEAK